MERHASNSAMAQGFHSVRRKRQIFRCAFAFFQEAQFFAKKILLDRQRIRLKQSRLPCLQRDKSRSDAGSCRRAADKQIPRRRYNRCPAATPCNARLSEQLSRGMNPGEAGRYHRTKRESPLT